MHKNAMKYNKTLNKWFKNKHGASKIIDTFETYQARANWLKHGDRNTNFFHIFASKRKKQNTIKCLVDDNGNRHEDRDSMCDVVYNYFTDLFTSEVSVSEKSVFDDV
jgi:hypothetical protein